jgi:hypothetical protein
MFSPVGRNFMFCRGCYYFCSSDFVSGKVDSSIVLRQSSPSTHEPNFRRAEFILELVGLRDSTSACFCATRLLPFSRQLIETLLSVSVSHICGGKL